MELQQIGKYRIIARLGQGGMASVFLCAVAGPAGVNKLLVLKLLKEELAHDEEFLTMFLDEARLAARLNHDNVVQTYEVGMEKGVHFLAMDFLDGQPLHVLLRRLGREGMPLELYLYVLAETLAGLHYAHTLTDFDGTPLEVVHRDVSPQNVFVTYDGRVKLVDFGVAKAAGAASITQSGVLKGKIAYMAPEQAAGTPVDARADIYSIGIMLWEAMAGKRFARGEAQGAILARRIAGNEPMIREEVPDVDPALAAICDRAMAHAPEDRFESGLAMRDALLEYLQSADGNVGARELGELVSGHFAEERDRIREVIDQQMKQLLRETAQALPVPTLELWENVVDHTPTAVTGRRRAALLASQGEVEIADSSPSSAGTGQSTFAGANLSMAAPAKRSNTTMIVGALAALVSVVGIAVVALMMASSDEEPVAISPARSASSDAAAETIQLEIRYGPEAATATLDGVRLVNSPFTARMPRDGTAHTLEVSAPGFDTQTTMLSYDQDIDLEIELEPESADGPDDEASAAPPPVAPPPPTMGRPQPPNPPAPPPAGKKPLGIDEEDPYGK